MLNSSIVETLWPKPIWKKCLAQFAFPCFEGSEHVIIKINSSLFKLFLFYSNSLKWQMFSWISLESNSWGRHPSLERERKFFCLMFTSFKQRRISNFHVMVVQGRQRNVPKSMPHVQNLLFSLTSPSEPAWQAFEREGKGRLGKGSFRCEGRARKEGRKRLPGSHCFSRF